MNIDKILEKKAKEAYFEFRKRTPLIPLVKKDYTHIKALSNEDLEHAIFLEEEHVREFKNTSPFLTELYKERKRRR